MKKYSQITIKDIAKTLGISASTVSRALKDHPDISPETKKAVTELAAQLNYQPNAIALSLRNNKTMIIGLMIPKIVHHFFASVISGIDEIATEANYNVMIYQSDECYTKEVKGINAFIQSRVDGVLVSVTKETQDFSHFENLLANGIPMVFFDRICPKIESDRVVTDDFVGAQEAVEYLINSGCKRIAHLAAPQNLLIGRNRQAGYINALRKHNIDPIDELIVKCDSHEDALNVVPSLLQLKNPPDGIFAVNESTAVAAIMAAKQKSLKIPEDISVIGFGDGPLSTIVDPALSTVNQPGYEMGKKAAAMLIERLVNDKIDIKPRTRLLETKLIIRDSTKPLIINK